MGDALNDLAEAGKQHALYGVDGERFKLDDVIYEAVEDPGDGYRSYLETIKVVSAGDSIFFDKPVATVKVVKVSQGRATYDDVDGYHLVDDEGHVWLQVGTCNIDDYYPCFRFVWLPKGGGA